MIFDDRRVVDLSRLAQTPRSRPTARASRSAAPASSGMRRERGLRVAEIERARAAPMTRDVRRGDRGDARARAELQRGAPSQATGNVDRGCRRCTDLPQLSTRVIGNSARFRSYSVPARCVVATFGVSDGASDRSDRRHATARRAHRHRRGGRGDRRRAARARSRTRPRSVHAQHARPPAPRRSSGRHALRSDPGADPAALVGARRRAAHRPLAAPGAGRARDELPRAAEPAADARQRLRLLVRALSGAVHARSARVRPGRSGARSRAARRCTPARSSSPTRSRRSSAAGCGRRAASS